MRSLPRDRRLWIALFVLVGIAAGGAVVEIVLPSRKGVAERVNHWRSLVSPISKDVGVSSDLVLAVIAVESKGDVHARSSKGAVGLMQLLPATAKGEAARLGIRDLDERRLERPMTNIRLGTSYLKRLLDRFHGDECLALAAYHAGPSRVDQWLKAAPGRSSREVIEKEAFSSTRSYVRDVLGYRTMLRK